MNEMLFAALVLTWGITGVGCWLGWQLLRQNGRILLRLEALEQCIEELNLDREGPDPQHLSHRPHRIGEGGSSENGKTKSRARSRINRDGLKAGARAPDFRLP